jgi:hypothetical protein
MMIVSKPHNTTAEEVLPTRKTISKIKMIAAAAAVQGKLIHEHDFAIVQLDKKTSCLIQCVTCNEYFCQLCGKTHCSCDEVVS